MNRALPGSSVSRGMVLCLAGIVWLISGVPAAGNVGYPPPDRDGGDGEGHNGVIEPMERTIFPACVGAGLGLVVAGAILSSSEGEATGDVDGRYVELATDLDAPAVTMIWTACALAVGGALAMVLLDPHEDGRSNRMAWLKEGRGCRAISLSFVPARDSDVGLALAMRARF